MRHIAVGENNAIGFVFGDEIAQLLFGINGDALGIQVSRQGCGVSLVRDARYLGGGEGDDLVLIVVAEGDVEIVEVAPRGAHDDDSGFCHAPRLKKVEVFARVLL